MVFEFADNDPTVEQAFQQLDSDISADAGQNTPPTPQPQESAKETPPAQVQDAESKANKPAPKEDGTPATTEVKTNLATPDDGKSKYARSIERGFTNWKEFSDWKTNERTKIENERKSFEAERNQFNQRRIAFDQERQQASQPKFKPEDYENHADKLELEAHRADAAGEVDKAAKLKIKAEDAREYAKNLRANPPQPVKTDAQAQEEFKAAQKQWWGKAAQDFPAVIKDGTPEKEALRQLVNTEPAIMADPKLMYFAAEFVTHKTAAASVPSLTKERDSLRAKVKELEEALEVPADGSVNTASVGEVPFEKMSDSQQEASLFQEARELGRFSQ